MKEGMRERSRMEYRVKAKRRQDLAVAQTYRLIALFSGHEEGVRHREGQIIKKISKNAKDLLIL